MKGLIWFAGLVFFVVVLSLAFLLAPASSHAWSGREAPGRLDDRRPRVVEAFRHRARVGHDRLGEWLERRRQELGSAFCSVATGELLELARAWEVDSSARQELGARIESWLVDVREQQQLDFVILVTQDGAVLRSGPTELSPEVEARTQVVCESVARDRGCRAAWEALPLAVMGGSVAGDGVSLSEPEDDESLGLVAGRALRARPDLPHPVLLGGIRGSTLMAEFRAEAGPLASEDLGWHVFAVAPERLPRVIAGDRGGETVRRGLLRDLVVRSVSEAPAFTEVGLQLGRWAALRSASGQLVGGYGVTVAPAALDAALVPSAESPSIAKVLDLPGVLDMIVIAVLVFAGLGVVWIFLALWARFVRPRTRARGASTAGLEAQDLSRALAVTQESVERVEAGFGSFIERAESLLERKLKSVADSPDQLPEELQSQLAGVFSRIGDFQKELQSTRDELRRIASEEERDEGARREDLAEVNGRLDGFDRKLLGIEERLGDFLAVVEERSEESFRNSLRAEAERLRVEWTSRIADFQREIGEACAQGKQLGEDLDRAREVEVALRADLAEAERIEGELRRRLEETHARGERLAVGENTAVRRSSELEQDNESLQAELDEESAALAAVRAELEQSRAGESAARAELAALSARIEARDRESAQEQAEQLAGAERRVAELATRTEELMKEIEALRVENEELRRELDRAREEAAILARDLESSEVAVQGFREERQMLHDVSSKLRERLEESERLRSELQASMGFGGVGIESAQGYDETRIETAEAAQDREDFLRLYEEVDRLRKDYEEERRIRAELEADLEELRAGATSAVGVSGRACAPTPEGTESLGREELLDTISRLRDELSSLRSEVEGVQGFQGALVRGNLAAPLGAVDERGRLFVWNPAAEDFWGAPASEALGETFAQVRTEVDDLRDSVWAEVRKCFESGSASTSELICTERRDGDPVWARALCEPVDDVDGRIVAVIFSVEDLTERAEAERECRLQGRFQDSLASSIPMGLVVTDAEFVVVSWNCHAAALVGVSEREALGRGLPELVAGRFDDAFGELLVEASKEERPTRFAVPSRDAEGRVSEALVTVSPFRAESGASAGWVLLIEETVDETVV